MGDYKEARYHRIPCLFNEGTLDIKTTNWFYGILVDINIWLDINVFNVEEFEIYIKENENNKI